jgi:3-deoxy-manno-octulosonate cytidylyltransferase (CMP-KDO synthetase)
MSEKTAIVIPARLDSTRLPNKPLIEFNGIPMIIHVANTCREVFDGQNVYVSTPDDQILSICDTFQIKSIKSSKNAASGTDRLAEFARAKDYTKVINVQGDELLLTKECLANFIEKTENRTNCTVGITKIISKEEFNKASVVKVAKSGDRMVFASRSPIPNLSYSKSKIRYKHTGLYMFTKDSLELFSTLTPGELEITEKVEILRFIENRVPVDVVEVSDYAFTIDTVEDVEMANSILETK